VGEQDEDDVKSLAQADLEVFSTLVWKKQKGGNGGFFNHWNMRPERLPSARQQRDGYNCGVYASLNWPFFVKLEHDQPSL
jgi:hypothetical protein